jgi:hypothetical protein
MKRISFSNQAICYPLSQSLDVTYFLLVFEMKRKAQIGAWKVGQNGIRVMKKGEV